MPAQELMAASTNENRRPDDTLGALPRELGVLFVVVGVGGILLPGPIGAPFLLAGAVALCPRAFGGLERGFQKRFPKLHREGARQMKRYLSDLDRRYPATTE